MRLLLDESLPRQLARELPDHDVRTVAREGWDGLSNGELLKHASDAGEARVVHQPPGIRFPLTVQTLHLLAECYRLPVSPGLS